MINNAFVLVIVQKGVWQIIPMRGDTHRGGVLKTEDCNSLSVSSKGFLNFNITFYHNLVPYGITLILFF